MTNPFEREEDEGIFGAHGLLPSLCIELWEYSRPPHAATENRGIQMDERSRDSL